MAILWTLSDIVPYYGYVTAFYAFRFICGEMNSLIGMSQKKMFSCSRIAMFLEMLNFGLFLYIVTSHMIVANPTSQFRFSLINQLEAR